MIYLDYAATTPLDERVLESMMPFMTEEFANPSSLYAAGRRTHTALEEARAKAARLIGAARPDRVVFTGCGTESDNAGVLGLARPARRTSGRDRIVVAAFEHKAVLAAAKLLTKEGFTLEYVQPRADGVVYADDLAQVVDDTTALVSVMHVNNEIGTVQPIADLARASHEAGALFHSDAVQSIGKIPFDARELDIDAASFSAHKFYGPKGVGALYLKAGVAFEPLIVGGGQEADRRSGTENLAGAVGFVSALQLMEDEREQETLRLGALRDALIDSALDSIPATHMSVSREALVPHIANLLFEGVEGESMLLHLDEAGIALSSGSACSSASLDPSHVLVSIGCSPELARGSLRVSLGRWTTPADVDAFLAALPPIVERLRSRSSRSRGL